MTKINLFEELSNKDLIYYYGHYNKLLVDNSDKESNPFYSYVESYIHILEDKSETFKRNRYSIRYHAGFAWAERHLLNTMAERFIEMNNLIRQLKNIV